MANGSLVKNRCGIYQAVFRFGGKQFSRTLGTKSKQEAKDALGAVRATIRRIEAGDLAVPSDADVGTFVVTHGRVANPVAESIDLTTLDQVIEAYKEAHPAGSKASNTQATEAIHHKHLKAHFGSKVAFRTLNTSTLQTYVSARSKKVVAATVQKELCTFSLLWHYAKNHLKIVAGDSPIKNLILGKTHDKAAFQTYAEILSKIERGGLDKAEEEAAWECLFLSFAEVKDFLKWAKEVCGAKQKGHRRQLPGFLFPMIAAAAYTGARRSELCRSEVEDWDLVGGTVTIRELKKGRGSGTFRTIDLHPELIVILKDWFADHPGGRWAFCEYRNTKMSVRSASHYFDKLRTCSSKWEVIHGFHTFRHSFASNLALRGVNQSVISSYMGHITSEMERRYRHLFPSEKKLAITALA